MKLQKSNIVFYYIISLVESYFVFVSGLMETFAVSALLEKDKEQSSTSHFEKAVEKNQKL